MSMYIVISPKRIARKVKELHGQISVYSRGSIHDLNPSPDPSTIENPSMIYLSPVARSSSFYGLLAGIDQSTVHVNPVQIS